MKLPVMERFPSLDITAATVAVQVDEILDLQLDGVTNAAGPDPAVNQKSEDSINSIPTSIYPMRIKTMTELVGDDVHDKQLVKHIGTSLEAYSIPIEAYC
ncbi:hypothetical protein O6H91_Y325900 [Diphasiastrum complanatum]|nr:hypothetical protein O6H91_Y325900 [Diphasiastrum complanatum]